MQTLNSKMDQNYQTSETETDETHPSIEDDIHQWVAYLFHPDSVNVDWKANMNILMK